MKTKLRYFKAQILKIHNWMSIIPFLIKNYNSHGISKAKFTENSKNIHNRLLTAWLIHSYRQKHKKNYWNVEIGNVRFSKKWIFHSQRNKDFFISTTKSLKQTLIFQLIQFEKKIIFNKIYNFTVHAFELSNNCLGFIIKRKFHW